MINSNLFGPNNRLFHAFPCLSDPARRFSLGLKVALVGMHLVFVGALFLIDTDLISKTKNEPWYTVIYLSFCIATLVQYFITASSSPGYVIDAMREVNESSMIHNPPIISKHPTSSKNGNFILTIDRNQPRNPVGPNATIWTKLVLDMYPPGTSLRTITCSYCNVEQPPRAKHCHDCGKCVLQFDHHCVWLGACIGQGNHCRFWWYICEETALCIWTGILYITYLKVNISTAGWKSAIIVFLLVALSVCLIFLLLLMLFHWYLILTNQTTYELVRRRRIPYLRGIPERVHPFSKGICRNLYRFCCAKISVRSMEQLPSQLEIEEKLRPYTCCDLVTCRCC